MDSIQTKQSSPRSSRSKHRKHRRTLFSRAKRVFSSAIDKIDQLPFIMALMIVAFLPLIYNGGETWWLPFAGICLTISYASWAMSAWWKGGRLSRLSFDPWALFFIIPLVAGAIQLIPGEAFTQAISPYVYNIWREAQNLNIGKVITRPTLAPDQTMRRCTLLSTCIMLFGLLISKGKRPHHVRLILLAIVLAATGNALVAYINAFATSNASITYGGEFKGTFLNRNHFAFLMMMGTLAATGLIAALSFQQAGKFKHAKSWSHLTIPLAICVFLLLTAQVLSLSRGAFLGTSVALLAFAAVWIVSNRKEPGTRHQKIIALASVIAVALLIGLPFALERLSERYEQLLAGSLTMDGRWQVWRDTAKLIKQNWLSGVGLGAYGSAIQQVESGNITSHRIAHAHNDLLELIAEIGIPLSVLLFVTVAFLWTKGLRNALRNPSRTIRWGGVAAHMAILGVTIHECVEFNLLAWANTTTFAALLAAAVICGRKPSQDSKAPKSPSPQPAHPRLARAPSLAIAILLMVGALPFLTIKLHDGWIYTLLRRDMKKEKAPGRPIQFDNEKRLQLLEKIAPPKNHLHLWNSALVKAEAASYNPIFWKQACIEIAHSCLREPTDGDVALQCATIWEQAANNLEIEAPQEQIQKLYEWAAFCQPTLHRTNFHAGTATYRAWLKAQANDLDPIPHKEKAVEYLVKALKLGSDKYDQILPILADLLDSTEQLANIVPDHIQARQSLLTLLIAKKDYNEAKIVATKLDQQLIDTPKQRAILLEKLASILEMLGQHDERKQVWNQIIETHRDLVQFDKAQELLERGEARLAANALNEPCMHAANHPKFILLKARIKAHLGFHDEVLHALTRLAYTEESWDKNIIDQAQNLLHNNAGTWRASSETRWQFLKAALSVMNAERNDDTPEEAIAQLKNLEEKFAHTTQPWLQAHLIPYYLGRAWVAMGNTENAIQAFRRSLENCPKNLYAINQIYKIDPRKLTQQELELHQLVHARTAPIGELASALEWLAVKPEKSTITEIYEEQTFTWFFICRSDQINQVRLTMTFADPRGLAFNDAIAFKKGDELTWRIGEIITVEKTWQPNMKALDHKNRILKNGPVTVQAGNIVTNAFNVNISTK